MKHTLTASLALALAIAVLPGTALAHKQWLVPSATVVASNDPWVSVDAAVSNQLYYPDHVPMRLDNIAITAPDGSTLKPQNPATGKYRSVFDVPPRSEAFDDEPLRPYNVTPDGLLMNFRSVIYTFTPDTARGRAQVRSEPPLAGLDVPADVPLAAGPCNDWRSGLKADFGDALRPRFAGSYPASCGERPWPVAFAQAEQYAPRMLEALWRQAGGRLGGQVRWGALPAQARLLVTHESLPLKTVVADINKMSNNVMAQQLFLTLSSELGAPGRFEASRLRLSRWWRQQFADLPEPVIENGSGLSREERSTARSLTRLLLQARRDPLGPVFTESLAIAGVDGTVTRMAERLPGSPLIGHAWLKTGSLRDVASVAGYVQGESGRLYAVVAIINHANARQARPVLDKLLDWTARDQATAPSAHARKRLAH